MESSHRDPDAMNAVPENVDAPVDSPSPAPAIAPNDAPAPTPAAAPTKRVHSLILDANAIIKNEPSVSSLIAQAEQLYTIPAVLSEIRDEATRSRLQTTLSPFLKLRTPRPESVQFVTNFARRTGDLQALSKPDLHLLALTYDLEVERNGGDWRLRREPNQKQVNGKPPGRATEAEAANPVTKDTPAVAQDSKPKEDTEPKEETGPKEETREPATQDIDAVVDEAQASSAPDTVAEKLEELNLDGQIENSSPELEAEVEVATESEEEDEDDGGGEWITPSNIKKYQARQNTSAAPQPIQKMLQAALITSDMAMRNVALRINLNLLDSGMSRITFMKTWVLRCHGCLKVCKDTSKQFCPSCGHATLTRVSCTTDASGNFTIHLKKNFQFNKRGNVYSIPKPAHGTPSGKLANIKGGGKGGWGSELILAEDQKEYVKKTDEDRRTKYRDLMDDDYLPGILTGSRGPGNGRIKVGAGRNVNSRKKR